MLSGITKKIRFLREIDTLYPRLFSRGYSQLRTALRLPPPYPYENNYRLDQDTQVILERLQKAIPDHQRGDSPSFSKNWKSIAVREESAKFISSQIKQVTPQLLSQADENLLRGIQDVGYTKIVTKNLSPKQVDEIVAYLDQQKVYPAHVAHASIEKPNSKDIIRKKSTFGSYDMETVVGAPYVAEMLADPEILSLITAYLGCLPVISGVNLFWAFANNDAKSRGIQRFHRDVDDYKSCTMFANLTDTREDDGAHCYISKSHVPERLKTVFSESKNTDFPEDLNPFKQKITAENIFQLPLDGYGFEKLYQHFLKEQIVNLHGERGTLIITDNYGIHRGLPSNKDRLVLWVSFALTATQAHSAGAKRQRRIPYSRLKDRIQDNKVNRYVLRNIIDFS